MLLNLYGRPLNPTTPTPTPTPTPATGTAPSPAPRGNSYALTAPIAVNVTANPKKPGTASAARFNLYANAPTVGAYVNAVVDAGYTRAKALADLRWDAKRAYITVG